MDDVNDVSRLLGLPYSKEAEEAVIYEILFDHDRAEAALSSVCPEDFQDLFCRAAFEAAAELHDSSCAVNAIAVLNLLEKAHSGLYARDMKRFMSMPHSISPFMSDFEGYLRIVRRDAAARRAVIACEKVAAMARNTDAAADDIAAYALEAFEGVGAREEDGFVPLEDGLGRAVDSMLDDAMGTGRGLLTGYASLDAILSGIRPQNLAILAARPGVGKTAFALNVALNAAKSNVPVLFFSLEMSAAEIYTRLLCMQLGTSMSKLASSGAPEAVQAALEGAKSELSQLPLHVCDQALVSSGQIRAMAARKARELRRQRDCIPLVVVDYLQLVHCPEKADNRALELGRVSRALKAMAKDLDVPVLALSQLSRAVESRASKKPQLSDLRESGAIEQDSDVVMFIDRSMDEDEAADAFRPALGEARVIVAKHRNGQCGTATLEFDGPTTTFSEVAFVPTAVEPARAGGDYMVYGRA